MPFVGAYSWGFAGHFPTPRPIFGPIALAVHSFIIIIIIRVFSLLFAALVATTARGDEDDFQRMLRTHQRSLVMDDFVPLDCNKGTECVPWSSKFGNKRSFAKTVTITCGECVRMDMQGSMTFRNGIDIHGTLEFPEPEDPSSQLTVVASKIIVQGLLKMRATKNTDGKPNYMFYMNREVEQMFRPFGPNAGKCPQRNCVVGMKSITVAGGQVDSKLELSLVHTRFSHSDAVVGIPGHTKTWTKLKDRTAPNEIIVHLPGGRWKAGSEILITGAGNKPNREVVRTITKIRSAGNANWRITLDGNLEERTTTEKDDPIAAVEVALLSRNIAFVGSPSEGSIGGHFWVMQTPGVKQHLEGVDIRGFGQAGLLGRYPIHLHFCNDSPDTGTYILVIRMISHSRRSDRKEHSAALFPARYCDPRHQQGDDSQKRIV